MILTPYMKHPAIVAVSIVDAEGVAFSAMWKQEDFRLWGETIPEAIIQAYSLSVSVDVVYYERKIGTLQLHYSDAALARKIEELREVARQEAALFTQESEANLQRIMISQCSGIGAILLVMCLCLLLLLKMFVRKPLLLFADIAHNLGQFDLTHDVPVTTKDEIGHVLTAINEMVQSFRTLIGQVQRSGIQVTSSATELSATAREQEAIMAQQVDSTHHVVTLVHTILDVTTSLVATMQEITDMAQETTDLTSSGQSDLERMETVMRRMEDASRSISEKLIAINEKAASITTVVTTITKVADQTNLLSLNASIEAEKAGEYGRGFTVVAREIRRLADQTAVATLDIEQTVQEMQLAVSSGITEMEHFITQVRQSGEEVGKISLQMSRIIEHVQALSPRFEEVGNAMEQQSQNARDISEAMGRFSEEMQETKNSFHETFTAIGQLNEAARNLHKEVSRFKVD